MQNNMQRLLEIQIYPIKSMKNGGGGGIRTHGGVAPTSVFKTGALNHSATPPRVDRINCVDSGSKRIQGGSSSSSRPRAALSTPSCLCGLRPGVGRGADVHDNSVSMRLHWRWKSHHRWWYGHRYRHLLWHWAVSVKLGSTTARLTRRHVASTLPAPEDNATILAKLRCFSVA